MSKADGKCNKCRGKGLVDAVVLHYGVPGLCYRCDGAGTYEAELMVKARAKKMKAEAADHAELTAKVWERRDVLPRNLLNYDARCELRTVVGKGKSTLQVAEALGISPREAFDRLAALYPDVCPARQADGSVIWVR